MPRRRSGVADLVWPSVVHLSRRRQGPRFWRRPVMPNGAVTAQAAAAVRKNAARQCAPGPSRHAPAPARRGALCNDCGGCRASPLSARGSACAPPSMKPPPRAAAGPVDWWEVISENFMVEGGNPRRVLRAGGRTARSCSTACRCRSGRPIRWTPATSIDWRRWRRRSSQPGSPTTSAGPASAVTARTICGRCRSPKRPSAHVAARVARVQERLGRRILVENARAISPTGTRR